MRRQLVACGLALGVVATPLCAQQGIQAAGGTTTLLTRSSSAVTLDAKESALTMLLKSGVSDSLRDWFSNTILTLSAEKNKRALFSKGEFVPGAKLERRLGRITYDTSFGYTAIYGSASVDVTGRPIARYTDAAKTQFALKDAAGTTVSLGAGFNWRHRPTSGVLGIGATASSGTALPSASRTSQVCTLNATGVDEKGKPVTASSCKDRYVGDVRTTRSGQVRVDWLGGRMPQRRVPTRVSAQLYADSVRDAGMLREASATAKAARDAADAASQALRTTLGDGSAASLPSLGAMTSALRAERTSASAAERAQSARDSTRREVELRMSQRAETVKRHLNGPTFGWIGATSSDFTERKKTAFNISFGPALYAPLAPDNIIGAFLFEVNDLSNASGDVPKRSDRFSIRLYIGVPF